MKTLFSLFMVLSSLAFGAKETWETLPVPVKKLHFTMNEGVCDFGLAVPMEIESYSLGRDKALYLIECTTGAYNVTSVAYILENSNSYPSTVTPVPVLTAQVDTEGQSWVEPTFLLGNAYFDPKKDELTTSFKGRGLGDCGVSSVTKIFLNDWGSVSVKTTEVRSQQECNEQFDKEWPLVFKQ